MITSGNVVPVLVQGVSAGEFSAIVTALRRGLAYANVHTSTSPGGEIRSQLGHRDHDHDD